MLVFLGASYFRALGKGQRYGISARGLAIDTALMSGEEFPRFTEFWIERPEPQARELRLYALLDSPRATGAYGFVLKPGVDTVLDVRAQLYLRQNVAKLGLAPLTSMYYFGENHRVGIDDFRPEVHDSDGLSIQNGTGEWIWRPLVNPKRLLVTSFAVTNPLGFGLLQRDRSFVDYEDLEARYETRPRYGSSRRANGAPAASSSCRFPRPTKPTTTSSRIFVARCVAAAAAAVRLRIPDAVAEGQRDASDARVRRADAARPRLRAQARRQHLADRSISKAPALRKLPADTPVQGVVSADSNIEIIEANAYRNDVTGGWRLALRLRRQDDKKPGELRAFLRNGGTTLSETWSYILPIN